MTRPSLHRAVAAALGEPLSTVLRIGFGPERPDDPDHEGLRLALDCPFCGRAVAYPGRSRDGSAAMAECDRCDVYFDFDDAEVYPTPIEPEAAALDEAA